MTYIVGFHQPGINAIISDARVSWHEGELTLGENTALKTGYFFPGCIFGRFGNDDQSRKFIYKFKKHIQGQTETVEGFWVKFEKYFKNYNYPKKGDQSFQLLLSSRASGTPSLLLLDSTEGITNYKQLDDIKDSNYLLTFGSGTAILDDTVTNIFIPRIQEIQKTLIERKLPTKMNPLVLTPYFLCLWLSEMSLSFEKSVLEQHQVGGIFHYIYQTSEIELTQNPAIYIYSSADRKERIIYSWSFRVVLDKGGLMIEEAIPQGQEMNHPFHGESRKTAIFDVASRPDFQQSSEEDIKKIAFESFESSPYYNFCGLGFTNPDDRMGVCFEFSPNGKKEDLFDNEGRIKLRFRNYIEDILKL